MTNHSTPVSRSAFWSGHVIGTLPVLLLAFSAAMKFARPPEVVEGFTRLGWPERLAVPLGVLELACAALYLVPRTAALGAILITGYLGGAIATHVRLGDPFVMPVLLGVLIWLGLFLRDRRVRALIPIRRPVTHPAPDAAPDALTHE